MAVSTIQSKADYVVEQGSNEHGSYRKWNSGIAECWIRTSTNVAINSPDGVLFLGNWTWDFPIEFLAAPAVHCSEFKWGTGASWGTVAGVTKSLAYLRAIDAYQRALGPCALSAYAIGKWK